jgi:endonuclease III
MVRGTVPRQAGKAGRQEGLRKTVTRVAAHKDIAKASATDAKKSPLPGASKNAAASAKARKDPKTRPSQKQARMGHPTSVAGEAGGLGKAASDYDPTAPARVREIIKRLDATYPGVTCALNHHNAWELLVATILSAQCTDERVNKVTPELFAKYPTPQDMAKLAPEQLEPEIRSTGFFRNKAKSIVGAAKMITSKFGGKVPNDMAELIEIPGVARKTANVVLGTWFGKNEGVVVDTHVSRIARRLELTNNDDPNKIEQDLMQAIPRDHWTQFAHQVIWHGRKLCTARMPKCADCPLENLCHAADKTWSTVPLHKTAVWK